MSLPRFFLVQSNELTEVESFVIGSVVIASIFGLLFIIRGVIIMAFDIDTSAAIGAKKFQHYKLREKKLTPVQVKILQQHFSYYQKLPTKSKKTFEDRVMKFCALKSFNGKGNLTITDEMKIYIAASAVQLTFGLRDFRFLHFDTIEVYPEKFYSKKGQAFHLGETDPRGKTLRFSWVDFVKGYLIADDNRNLGLHEFSHALFLNYLSGKKSDVHFDKYYEVWKSEGSEQYFRLKENENTYIREYAQTNLMEFFAVCVECFFETPHKLYEYHPKIFNSIKKLLGQDPRVLNKLAKH